MKGVTFKKEILYTYDKICANNILDPFVRQLICSLCSIVVGVLLHFLGKNSMP